MEMDFSRERAWAKRMVPFEQVAREWVRCEKELEEVGGFCEMTSGFQELYSQHITMRARPTLEIVTMSKRQIEQAVFHDQCVVISVCEPGKVKAKIPNWRGTVLEVLQLEFHDADGGKCNDCSRPLSEAPPMQASHGTQVIDFIEKHLTEHIACFIPPIMIEPPEGVPESRAMYPLITGTAPTPLKVFIHCTAGICRSTGIAQALAWIYNFDEKSWRSLHDFEVFPSHYTYSATREGWKNRCKAERKP